MELLKLLDIKDIAAQIVCFFLVFFLLRKFAWKQILGILDQRKERIASEFTKIEELKKQAQEAKAEYAAKIEQIEQAARQKINEAVAEAERVAEQIKISARQDSQKMVDKAKDEISREMIKAREELKAGVVNLALSAAQKIVSERLNSQDEEKIVADFLIDLEKMQ